MPALATARGRAQPDPGLNDRAILTLALVGTWSVAGFLYYLNRSFAAEQLQTLLMPCGVCVVALLSLARDTRARLPRENRSQHRIPTTTVGVLPDRTARVARTHDHAAVAQPDHDN